jgi:hypothetical protein
LSPGVNPTTKPLKKDIFVHFFAIRLGCFEVIALFSYDAKLESLTSKIGKQRKMQFGRITHSG